MAAIHPNAGIKSAYQTRLSALIDDMNDSVMWWVRAAYRSNEPEVVALAADASPAKLLQAAVRRLAQMAAEV